jgi:uncharacterized membrane protein
MYSLVCHQIPERSLTVFGVPLSVCSRCTAIYGAFTVFMFLALVSWFRPLMSRMRGIGMTLVLPMLLDVALDASGLLHATMASRLITGSLAGAGLALFLASALIEDHHTDLLPESSPSITGDTHD